MNLEDAIMLPFKYLRKNEDSKSHSAPTSSLLECMNLIRNNRSHDIFIYLRGKPRLGMPLNMRNDDLDVCTVRQDLPRMEC